MGDGKVGVTCIREERDASRLFDQFLQFPPKITALEANRAVKPKDSIKLLKKFL